MRGVVLFGWILTSVVNAGGPVQSPTEVHLGPKFFRDGDVIEITEVTSTSPQLEPGDRVNVRGRVRLDSRPAARLCLYLTQSEGDGYEESDHLQETLATKGLNEFELAITVKHRGHLQVTLYAPQTSRPFGGVYFGTGQQMAEISHWNFSHDLDWSNDVINSR